MNHRVYTGSFAGLERRWLDEVASLQSGDPLRAVDVLVGSNVLATYLKVLLARQGRAAANVRFHTFLDLVTALARVETPARPRLPRLGNITILDELLEADVPDEFKNVVSYPGFRANLLDNLPRPARRRDLRAGPGPKPAGAEASDAGTGSVISRESRRCTDGSGARSSASTTSTTISASRSATHRARRKASRSRSLLVYGIYDATGQQEDLLGA